MTCEYVLRVRDDDDRLLHDDGDTLFEPTPTLFAPTMHVTSRGPLKRPRLPKLVRGIGDVVAARRARRARAPGHHRAEAAIFPDPAKFAHGLYTEGEVGAVVFFGPAGEDVAPGFAIGARVGYDLFRFFAVQAHCSARRTRRKARLRWWRASSCRPTRGRSRGS